VITGVIVHLENDLPIMVDLEDMPQPSDRLIRCTNVRTVDGKRPSFVNDKRSTFIFPLEVIRLIEAPAEGSRPAHVALDEQSVAEMPPAVEEAPDEEPDEDLLARIRSI
jgi:hypothetical protein